MCAQELELLYIRYAGYNLAAWLGHVTPLEFQLDVLVPCTSAFCTRRIGWLVVACLFVLQGDCTTLVLS